MREEIVRFGERQKMAGIITYSSSDTRNCTLPAIIFVNCWPVHRTGHSRIHVVLSRRFAEIGYTSLRCDVLECSSVNGQKDYCQDGEKSAVHYVQLAMDYLNLVLGSTRFVLMGLCAGADWALWVSMVDDRVAGLILVDDNTLCFGDSPTKWIGSDTKCLIIYSEKIVAMDSFRMPVFPCVGNNKLSQSVQLESPKGMDHLLLTQTSQLFVITRACSWLQSVFNDTG